MQRLSNAVRNVDMFAVPVSLTYKGKNRFNTFCGGCFSLLIILAFVIYSGIAMHKLITKPVLWSNSEVMIIPNAKNTQSFIVDTKVSTVAM